MTDGFDFCIKKGQYVQVKKEMFTRGGQYGLIVEEPCMEGVCLDFFCDINGNPRGLPSIEFWSWSELEI